MILKHHSQNENIGDKLIFMSKSDPSSPRQHKRQRSLVKIKQNSVDEAKVKLSKNLSFCGCGFLGIYHVGVASSFHEYAPQLSMQKIAGSSVGSIVAVAHICGNLQLAYATTDIIRVAIDARARALGPFHPSFDINAQVRSALERGLPDDVHLIANGKLHISLTRVHDGANVIISQFNSKEDVIQALICSCFIPFWSGLVAPKYKGTTYIDGGFSNNLLILDDKTITVSPFAGEADICPQDSVYNLLTISLSNTSFSLTPHNLYRLSHALLPPAPEMLRELYEQGFTDGLRFLQRMNLISCNKCLEIKSNLVSPQDESVEYMNQTFSYSDQQTTESTTIYDEHMDASLEFEADNSDIEEEEFDCGDCKLRRKNASVDAMPKHFTERIREACDTVNKSLSYWFYYHRPIKSYLSYLATPYYIPWLF